MSDNNSEVTTETVVEVDVSNTDNLDDFEAAYFGTAEPKEEVEEVEEEVIAVDETDAEADTEQDAAEDEEEDEDPQPEPEQKKNRKSAKERISELTAKVREAEQARNALEARLAKLEKPEPKEEPAPTAQDKAADGRPDPDAVDEKGELIYPLGKFDPEFAADTVRWTFKVERDREAAAAAARAEEEAKIASQNELVTNWNAKLEATEEEVPELREKIAVLESNFTDLEPTHGQFLVETIMGLDRGPEVLLYLADNLSEAEAIVAASPVAATLALGRIEGRLSAPKSEDSNKKKVSTAPKPPVQVRGTSASKPVQVDTDNLEDFERVYFRK